MSMLHVFRGVLVGGLIAGLIGTSAAAPIVDESLAPAEVTVGDSAQLRIKTLASDMQPVELPAVPGLEFRVVEQLHGIELIHGATLATLTTVVRVTPQIAGTFIVPSFGPGSQPLMLRVLPAGVAAPAAARPGAAGTGTSKGLRMAEDGSAFIRLGVGSGEAYVGESVPISIEVGLRAGVVSSLNGLPTLTGSDFTLNDLSRKPDRKETSVDGNPFVLLIWHSVIVPVKTGNFSLTVEIPLTDRVSTRPRGEAQLEDQLGDPFMQHIFGATVPKNIKAQSPPFVLSVNALPAEGKPADFSGAVGSFRISSDLSSTTAAVGDPLTLRMHVTGRGNFDRVDSSMLEHLDHWKTYPPTSSFKQSDANGLEGEKTFEQPVIASMSGGQTLPPMSFCYFDPLARRYETLHTSPLRVTISPPPSADAQSPAGAAPGPAHSWSELRGDRALPGVVAGSLTPLYLRPGFLPVPSLIALVFATAWFLVKRRPGSTMQAAMGALSQMEEAARAADRARFFRLARRILQDSLAASGPDGGVEIRRLLALADEASYAAPGVADMDWARWMEIVRNCILERTS